MDEQINAVALTAANGFGYAVLGFVVCYVLAGAWIMICFHLVNRFSFDWRPAGLMNTTICVLFWPWVLLMES